MTQYYYAYAQEAESKALAIFWGHGMPLQEFRNRVRATGRYERVLTRFLTPLEYHRLQKREKNLRSEST